MESEENLIIKLKSPQEQEAGFRILVEQYKERLYWHIRSIVKSHHDADDVLQNTFIKIFGNIDGFKGDSRLFSWMYRIATNESINFINKKARNLKITDEEYQNRTIQNLRADPYFEGDSAQLKLQEAIATLPSKQQLVFNMRYFEEIKYKDMAEILETSEGALKASYHIASKKIEEFLKNH